MDTNPILMKNFGFYKLMVKSSMGDQFNMTDEDLIENYAKLILSDPSSLYQTAPNVEPSHKPKHSQKPTQDKPSLTILGVTPQQALDLKRLLVKALIGEEEGIPDVSHHRP